MPAPVINIAQMRKWEKASWAAGRNEAEVISRVGHLVTARARHMTRQGDLILVLAGKGHNGDDARYTSQNLTDREVYLINVADPKVGLEEFTSQLSLQPSLIIDGLFGIGLDRPLDDAWLKLIEAINDSRIPILAIDTPSGLNADSGEPQGAALRATVTLTLGAPKRGLILPKAWSYVGRLEVEPHIGLITNPLTSEVQWTLADDFIGFPPRRPVEGHKGTFGHLVIFAGSLGYHGASVLSTRGALQSCPGLVTLVTAEDVYIPVASQLQSAMVQPWKPGFALPHGTSGILFGPGMAVPNLPGEMKAELLKLWSTFPGPVVVDASGLEWLVGAPKPVAGAGVRVITPHPGEAARVLGIETAAVQANRPKALVELSRRLGNCWVVLKGYQTMIGREAGGQGHQFHREPVARPRGQWRCALRIPGRLARSAFRPIRSPARFALWRLGARRGRRFAFSQALQLDD